MVGGFPKGITREMLDAVVEQLKLKIPQLDVLLFPEHPSEYRLNHPTGALLVSYLGGRFEQPNDLTFVTQPRTVVFTVTALMRQLHGNAGVIDVLDAVRLALTGFKPPNCRRKVYIQNEKFLGETAGIWQYATDFATEIMQIEYEPESSEPVLTLVTNEESE